MTAPKNYFDKDTQALSFAGLRFRKRTATNGITLHCSATRPSQDLGVLDIDYMHRRQGWLSIGYHFVITRSGTVQFGRPMDTCGAHCANGNRNRTHVSVCLIGGVSEKPQTHTPGSPWNGSDAECNFTPEQGEALAFLTGYLMDHYGLTPENIEGHRDVPGVRKACPSFNVEHWKHTGDFSLD